MGYPVILLVLFMQVAFSAATSLSLPPDPYPTLPFCVGTPNTPVISLPDPFAGFGTGLPPLTAPPSTLATSPPVNPCKCYYNEGNGAKECPTSLIACKPPSPAVLGKRCINDGAVTGIVPDKLATACNADCSEPQKTTTNPDILCSSMKDECPATKQISYDRLEITQCFPCKAIQNGEWKRLCDANKQKVTIRYTLRCKQEDAILQEEFKGQDGINPAADASSCFLRKDVQPATCSQGNCGFTWISAKHNCLAGWKYTGQCVNSQTGTGGVPVSTPPFIDLTPPSPPPKPPAGNMTLSTTGVWVGDPVVVTIGGTFTDGLSCDLLALSTSIDPTTQELKVDTVTTLFSSDPSQINFTTSISHVPQSEGWTYYDFSCGGVPFVVNAVWAEKADIVNSLSTSTSTTSIGSSIFITASVGYTYGQQCGVDVVFPSGPNGELSSINLATWTGDSGQTIGFAPSSAGEHWISLTCGDRFLQGVQFSVVSPVTNPQSA